MITGYNTDVRYEGKVYHVQTEDKGLSNPVIETLIYVGGEILTAKRTPYEHLLKEGGNQEPVVVKLLEAQHKRLIREIREGRHDPEGLKPIGEGLITDRTLDEVVLDYIRELLRTEKLDLTPLSEITLREGTRCRVQLLARGNLTGRPIRNAEVTFRIESPSRESFVLLQERTGTDGVVTAELPIPSLEGRGATLVVAVKSDAGGARWHRAVAPAGGEAGS